MNTALPAAILWDLDGTLVDTEPYWIRAETELVQSFGERWTHADALGLVGKGMHDSARILQSAGVSLPADEIVARMGERVRQQLEEVGIPWRPGAHELLAAVRNHGIPSALVTMSLRSVADHVSNSIPFDAFDMLITGDSVSMPKPHPEAYLTAAKLLGVNIAHCVAIEDSPTGMASAIASGAATIAVPHILPIAEGPTHTVWRTLEGRTVQDLRHVLDRFAG